MLNKEAKVEGDNNITIQNSDNSTIVVNLNNPEDVKNALLDIQGRISQIPLDIIQKLMEHNNENAPIAGAKVYLSVNLALPTYNNRLTGTIAGISFGVTVINTCKEHRYFYEPSFKSSVPIDGHIDTFMMVNKIDKNLVFPKRLEYGEPFTIYYNVPNMDVFKKLIAKDEEAKISAVVNTTLGDVFLSDPYPLKKLLQDEKYMRNLS